MQILQTLKDEYAIESYRKTIKEDIDLLMDTGFYIEFIKSSQHQYDVLLCFHLAADTHFTNNRTCFEAGPVVHFMYRFFRTDSYISLLKAFFLWTRTMHEIH